MDKARQPPPRTRQRSHCRRQCSGGPHSLPRHRSRCRFAAWKPTCSGSTASHSANQSRRSMRSRPNESTTEAAATPAPTETRLPPKRRRPVPARPAPRNSPARPKQHSPIQQAGAQDAARGSRPSRWAAHHDARHAPRVADSQLQATAIAGPAGAHRNTREPHSATDPLFHCSQRQLRFFCNQAPTWQTRKVVAKAVSTPERSGVPSGNLVSLRAAAQWTETSPTMVRVNDRSAGKATSEWIGAGGAARERRHHGRPEHGCGEQRGDVTEARVRAGAHCRTTRQGLALR